MTTNPTHAPTRHTSAAALAAAIESAAAGADERARGRYLPADQHGPTRPGGRLVFLYQVGDFRGQLALQDSRASLLQWADKVRAQSGAFNGRTRQAPKPRKPAGAGSPYAAARNMATDGNAADAARLVRQACGPLYLAPSTKPGAVLIFAKARTVQAGGHDWIIGRILAPGGRWRIVHKRAGVWLSRRGPSLPHQEFSTADEALAALLEWTNPDDPSGSARRIIAAADAAPTFDQAAALAQLLGPDEATPEPEPEPVPEPVQAPAPKPRQAPTLAEINAAACMASIDAEAARLDAEAAALADQLAAGEPRGALRAPTHPPAAADAIGAAGMATQQPAAVPDAVPGILAELDRLTHQVRARLPDQGDSPGAELDAMTADERARRHALVQALPTFADERAAAAARIRHRVAARQAARAAPCSGPAAPPPPMAPPRPAAAVLPPPVPAPGGRLSQLQGAACPSFGQAGHWPGLGPPGPAAGGRLSQLRALPRLSQLSGREGLQGVLTPTHPTESRANACFPALVKGSRGHGEKLHRTYRGSHTGPPAPLPVPAGVHRRQAQGPPAGVHTRARTRIGVPWTPRTLHTRPRALIHAGLRVKGCLENPLQPITRTPPVPAARGRPSQPAAGQRFVGPRARAACPYPRLSQRGPPVPGFAWGHDHSALLADSSSSCSRVWNFLMRGVYSAGSVQSGTGSGSCGRWSVSARGSITSMATGTNSTTPWRLVSAEKSPEATAFSL